MHLSNNKENRKLVEKLQDKASDRLVEQELPEIPGAVKRFEKLEAKIKKLEEKVEGQEVRIQKLINEKFQREMGGN